MFFAMVVSDIFVARNYTYELIGNERLKFYEAIAKQYDLIFPHRRARLDFVLSFFSKGPQEIVDLGCATGALAIALAVKGHRVRALDLNEQMVSAGKERALELGLAIEFYAKDMCEVESVCQPESQSCALCFGNTLVHLESLGTVTEFCAAVAKVLKPGAFFLGQIVNYDRILSLKPKGLPTIENEHIRFERLYHYGADESKIVFRANLLVKESKQESSEEVTLLALTKEQLQSSLVRAGFSSVHFYSDYERSAWSIQSTPTFFVAWK